MNLRVPGPTPCPPEVLAAGARPMINHRGRDFAEMIQEITSLLKEFFKTKNDVLILTASGTGAMEASIVNTLSPGDKVLAVTIGAFGDRFAAIAEAFGARVTRLQSEWGHAADPQAIDQALAQDPEIKAVMVTHNETSTGITNDLAAISAVVHRHNKLLLVDAISSLGSIDLPVDEWGCDVVMTASQKGWMTPPGLAMVSVSPRAWEAQKTAKMPRFYWDFSQAKRFGDINATPWTPAVSVIAAMREGLRLMKKEGQENIFARQARVATLAREGVKSLGLSLLADERWASNTVTAVKMPEGIDSKRFLEIVRDEHNVELAEGQGALAGKIFRIGHLGYVNEDDIREALQAIRATLISLGHAPEKTPASGRPA
ncbi:MAG: class aminotransferase [Dehalococcoidia bacterium]|nr:class aminotransferase [Dehalococcoidia bacterium]